VLSDTTVGKSNWERIQPAGRTTRNSTRGFDTRLLITPSADKGTFSSRAVRHVSCGALSYVQMKVARFDACRIFEYLDAGYPMQERASGAGRRGPRRR